MRLLRILKVIASVAVCAAACHLAYLASFLLVSSGAPLVLAAFTKVELANFQGHWAWPRVMTRLPSDSSTVLYGLYYGGWLFFGIGWIALLLAGLRRAGGWLRLLLAYMVFWSSVVYLVLGTFRLDGALRVLDPGHAGWRGWHMVFWILAGVLGLTATYKAARWLLDGIAAARAARVRALLHWLLLPLGIIGGVLSLEGFRPWRLPNVAVSFGPALVAALAGVPAAWQRARPGVSLVASPRGAAVVLAALSLTLGVLLRSDDLARLWRRADFVTGHSSSWSLHFESRGVSLDEQSAVATAAEQRLAALRKRLALQPTGEKLRAYLYASAEAKSAAVGSDEPFTVRGTPPAVHHLLSLDGRISDPRGDALLLMRIAWGRPGSETVARAIARYAVGDFYGIGLADYAARITREEGNHTLRGVLRLTPAYLSPLVADALSGAWVGQLVGRGGSQILRAVYAAPLASGAEEKFARSLGTSWERLEQEWHGFQLSNAQQPPPAAARPRPAPFFHRGISFTHELGGTWGYGSSRAQQELTKLREVDANAVALIPYASTGASQRQIAPFAGERDDRVIRTIQAARRAGLHTALKPQLWGSGFTGNITFTNDAGFERWFGMYRRLLFHYARLAELFGVDLLVIGTELGGVTGREAAWRSLIADLRRIYSGPLTYAASWGGEFEKLAFWDALDYLGVNMYYPLAAPGETPDPGSPRVKELIEKFAACAREYNKPVLFTEVGYPASGAAATRPWDSTEASLDVELQKQCYATIFEAFYRQPWFAGLYWWKWPSHGDGSRFDNSHNPIGKPAAEVIARWYRRTTEQTSAPSGSMR